MRSCFDCRPCVHEFAADLPARKPGQQDVRPGVVTEGCKRGLAGRKMRPISDEPADQEEGGSVVCFAQDAYHTGAVRAGAVVERQGNGIAMTAAAPDGATDRG
jgi:hypothetical protein